MKNIFSKFVLVAFLFTSLVGTATAEDCKTCPRSNSSKAASMRKAAAVCKRAQSTAELNVNNVRALINGYGNMWYDGSVAQYHLPKNSNTCPLFCAALWIGGTDVNKQLRIAALRFGSEGDDYWPGPLSLVDATVDRPVCDAYDKHFVITKAQVQTLMSMFSYTADGVEPIEGAYDDNLVADVIKQWPAHGKFENQSHYLAPFYDADGDGEYNYMAGDYPYYDFANTLCPRTLKASLKPGENYHPAPTMEDDAGFVHGGLLSDQVLKGDQTIWWVFNDMGDTHTESDGQPIGLEIRAQAFAFSTNDEINNMTFYSYEIINRSSYTLQETYFSQWVDADLGYAWDDFVGCDVKRGLGYCYNGDDNDGPGSGSYSGIPPAVGIDFFQGPYMDPDGIDNPKIDIAKMRLYYPNQLKQYELPGGGYDTISLTDDADLYYPTAWYFQKDDSVGNCAINGVNFGNNIIDDERFGMRRFVYYDNGSSNVNGEPNKAIDYYNYLRGYWLNGKRMKFGGNAINDGTTELDCDFMFPGDSDPLNWGTNGEDPVANGWDRGDWTELTALSTGGNTPNDRRFMQSAGPFTLKPGALNYITVGIPFAQATSGNNWSSVELLREIDDVCQALFENCFKVLDGPDAPTLVVQELKNEVILYITYDNPESNNYGERYCEEDPAIVKSYVDAHGDHVAYTDEQRSYKFEGYQIYQLKDATASIADIGDVTKARLVAQCDIENYYDSLIIEQNNSGGYDTTVNQAPTLPIGTLVNYESNSTTGLLSGTIMVNGSNSGIQHVFRVTTDQFATGTSSALVNNKEYYFICVAYAHNRFKEYSQTEAAYLDGQKEPYLAGRKNEWGGTISPVTAIPHDPIAENGGTLIQAEFGMMPNVTRIEGYGNGGNALVLKQWCIDSLMGPKGVPGMAPGTFNGSTNKMKNPCMLLNPEYEQNAGPIAVKVIDPLNIKEGEFVIAFTGVDADSKWVISRADGQPLYNNVYTDTSDFTLGRYNEQLFLDLGIAVSITNPNVVASDLIINPSITSGSFYDGGFAKAGSVIGSTMTYENNNYQWLLGIPDNDSYPMYNWIRSGTQFAYGNLGGFTTDSASITGDEIYLDEDYYKFRKESRTFVADAMDKYQDFEKVVGGLWAPYGLVSTREFHPGFNFSYYIADKSTMDALGSDYDHNKLSHELLNRNLNKALMFNDLRYLPSVRIVFTSDTSKWTRCPVVEMCDDYTQAEGQARRFSARKHLSVNKDGKTVADLGITPDKEDPSNPAYIAETGMGWFPGYAINVATGERLNMMFGEDSRYIQYNGRDMVWNPVQTMQEGAQNYVMGGRHFIYVLNSSTQLFYELTASNYNDTKSYKTPSYDAGRWAISMLSSINRYMDIDDVTRAAKHGLVKMEMTPMVLPERDSISMLYASVAWVNMPLVSERFQFTNPQDIPCDVTVDINVNMPYKRYLAANSTNPTQLGATVTNDNNPKYTFKLTSDITTQTGMATAEDGYQSYKDSILAMINVVPNPYYSQSAYETTSQLETKVRFVNLPTGVKTADGRTVNTGCTISIYTVDGTLVRKLGPTPVNATTYDWDLHNHTGLPIAGGMYLIHISVPGIGERVIKWFGTMRPVDFDSFQF